MRILQIFGFLGYLSDGSHIPAILAADRKFVIIEVTAVTSKRTALAFYVNKTDRNIK